MPYGLKKKGSQVQVVNQTTGRVLGTHPNHAAAVQQLRAVYAATKGK